MNKVYQRIWSKVKERWVLVDEKVASKSCFSGIVGAITLAAFLSLSGTVFALDRGALPTGGKITAGIGSIFSVGRQMTVNQSTEKMIATWETFNIGSKASVTFKQPDEDSVALNRIYDQNPSQILGTLSANGKIYLINPSGIVFGEGSQVNVGGLVASSLNMADSDFLAGHYTFLNDGKAGSIINKGNINAANGGVVALLAPKVTNEGTITANGGSVILGAGNQVTLDFTGDGLINYTVDKGAIDALAENKGLIKADGGIVIMTAKAADSLTQAVVNNSGVIEAQTLENKCGRILLLSDMENGQTIVSGKLDASAPNGGNGGFIETSAANVKVNDDAIITTIAPQGMTGSWLIDPPDFTIAARDAYYKMIIRVLLDPFNITTPSNEGDMTGKTLSTSLKLNNVEILSANGATGTNGDVNVNAKVSWKSNNTLTLSAYRNVNINANIEAKGDTAGLTITPDTGGGGGNYYLNNDAVITLSGSAPSLIIAGDSYTVINKKNGGVVALQNINNNLSGYYVLGTDIKANATSTWNLGGNGTYSGFVPIGNTDTPFTGQFDGLGHSVNNLTINWTTNNISDQNPSQILGTLSTNGKIYLINPSGIVFGEGSQLNLGGSIIGTENVGGLVGSNGGSIADSYVLTAITTGSYGGSNQYIGGLVGFNNGSITNSSYATGTGTGSGVVGGLVGSN